METLKVSTRSNPNSVAGAMAGVLRQDGAVVVQVVGAGALNQAIKAVAITRGYVATSGLDVVCVPTFADVEIDGERRTAIRLTIEHRARPVAGAGEARPAMAADPVIDLRGEPPPAPVAGLADTSPELPSLALRGGVVPPRVGVQPAGAPVAAALHASLPRP